MPSDARAWKAQLSGFSPCSGGAMPWSLNDPLDHPGNTWVNARPTQLLAPWAARPTQQRIQAKTPIRRKRAYIPSISYRAKKDAALRWSAPGGGTAFRCLSREQSGAEIALDESHSGDGGNKARHAGTQCTESPSSSGERGEGCPSGGSWARRKSPILLMAQRLHLSVCRVEQAGRGRRVIGVILRPAPFR